MAIQQRMRVLFEDVFPEGAFVVGEVEPVEDYELIRAAREAGREPGDVQTRDKVTEKRVWQVRVVDGDSMARKGQTEVVVKIGADQQPVPPPKIEGLPFRPVMFENLTVTAWIDDRGNRPNIAWSFRADGMRAPKPGEVATPSKGPAAVSEKGAA